jgi:hypothetical protein
MRFLILALTIFSTVSGTVSEKTDADGAELEKEIAAIVAGPQVTVVHFWAPWCSNCAAEMRADGWPKFVNGNPEVKVVFLSVWHQDQAGDRKLTAAGLGTQENFLARTHPNPASDRGKRLERFMGLPLGWVPSTWVFREGNLLYALNHGEMRFEMLQQMVKDGAMNW